MPKKLTSQNGEIVWQGSYDEYGRVENVNGDAEQNIRFQGQYEDAETGLFYNRFRYYDADGCRYINQDPIGLNGDVNFYTYCKNPLIWTDAFGLDDTKVVVIGEGQDAVDEATRKLRGQNFPNAEGMNVPRNQWRGGRLYSGMPDSEFNKAVEWNKNWLKAKIADGYTVFDIGRDGRLTPSKFYEAELAAVKEMNATKYRINKFKDGETIEQMRDRVKGSC